LSTPRVKVPVHSCEHYHCVLKPFGIKENSPSILLFFDSTLFIISNFIYFPEFSIKVIRDYDGCIYMRYNEGGGLLFGGFEKEAKPIFHESSPKDFENKTLPPDLDHFCITIFICKTKILNLAFKSISCCFFVFANFRSIT
jgi:pyruvate dehydrogenase phosphatase regulatory subunit